jgi:hypothetical protein
MVKYRAGVMEYWSFGVMGEKLSAEYKRFCRGISRSGYLFGENNRAHTYSE